MRRFLIHLLRAGFLATTLVLGACATSGAKTVSVREAGQYVATKAPRVAFLDANTDDVRKDKGVIPGAIKLSSYDRYALSELPQDKETLLIFYCYNWLCTASDEAAGRAIKAGYTNVARMPDGIAGWQEFKAGAEK
jgi:rhodanese-related sulfurtransferase